MRERGRIVVHEREELDRRLRVLPRPVRALLVVAVRRGHLRYLSICLSISLSIHLSIYVSIYPSTCVQRQVCSMAMSGSVASVHTLVLAIASATLSFGGRLNTIWVIDRLID